MVKNLLKKSLSGLGYYRLLRKLKKSDSHRLLILMYHDLEDGSAPDSAGSIFRSRPDRIRLEAHLRTIHACGKTTTVDEAVDTINKIGELREDSIAVTFDDGYESVYHIAYPLLRKYDIPATVFLTTGWIDGEFSPWWEDLTDMIAGLDPTGNSIREIYDLIGLRETSPRYDGQNDLKTRIHLHETLAGHFRKLPNGDVVRYMTELSSMLNFERPDNQPKPLNWDQIREMSENGIRFESHTRTHPNLRDCDENHLERELLESKAKIEHKIEKPVTGFAYPYGQDVESYRKTRSILSKNGFSYACTACLGINDKSTDPFLLYRETLPTTTSKTILDREINLDFIR